MENTTVAVNCSVVLLICFAPLLLFELAEADRQRVVQLIIVLKTITGSILFKY